MKRMAKPAIVSSILSLFYLFPYTAQAECVQDIIGKWQQTHVVFGGNSINDESQSWDFKDNGKVRFVKTSPKIDESGEFSCEGDIIYMKGAISGRLKILEHDGETMAWESLDHGGGITHIKRIKE